MEEKPASGSAEPHDSEPRRTDPEHQHNITPRYTYSRLSSDHASIRLIEVLPGNNESPLQCQLSHHPLDSDLQFYALSYTWDQGGGYQDIGCDGRNLRVTKNLCNFLLQFRETETRQFLWVDAICIDQENFEERSSQVQLMRRIYSDATRVFVWLGNANSTTALAFRLIEDTILDQIDKSIWDENAVVELLSRPYWSRVWIIQEFFLARTTILCCGPHSVDIPATFFFPGVPLHDKNSHRSTLRHSPGYLLLDKRNQWRERPPETGHGDLFSMSAVLQRFATAQTSEVLDKVYGLLGLATDAHTGLHPIFPDYCKTPAQLLIDVVQHQCKSWHSSEQIAENRRLIRSLKQSLKVSAKEVCAKIIEVAPDLRQHLYAFSCDPRYLHAICSKVGTVVDVKPLSEVQTAMSSGEIIEKWNQALAQNSSSVEVQWSFAAINEVLQHAQLDETNDVLSCDFGFGFAIETPTNLDQRWRDTTPWVEQLFRQTWNAQSTLSPTSTFSQFRHIQKSISNRTIFLDDRGFVGIGVHGIEPDHCVWTLLENDGPQSALITSSSYSTNKTKTFNPSELCQNRVFATIIPRQKITSHPRPQPTHGWSEYLHDHHDPFAAGRKLDYSIYVFESSSITGLVRSGLLSPKSNITDWEYSQYLRHMKSKKIQVWVDPLSEEAISDDKL